MRHRELLLDLWQGIASIVLVAMIVLGASPRLFASGERVSGQVVSGGGRSVATDRVIVGAIVLGPTGGSSDGTTRLDGGTIHYAKALTATYAGVPAEVVDAGAKVLKVAVIGGTGAIEGRFFSRLGGQSAYTMVAMAPGAGDTITYTVSAARLTLRGLEYYFEVDRGSSTAGVGSASEPFAFTVRLQNASGSTLPSNQYRMIGFPFDVSPGSPSQVFEDDLGTYDTKVWRLGRYNAQSEAYDEYPGVGTITRGRGYWLIVKDGQTVGASGTSAWPDTTITDVNPAVRYARMILQPGWNQIATPFAFPLAWDDRVAESGIESVIWAYTSGFDEVTSYVEAETLEPFSGYWLFNSSASSRRLLLPYAESPGSGIARRSTQGETADWRINLVLTAGKVADLTNIAGTASIALVGVDEIDFSEPPVIGDYISLAFLSDAATGSGRLLAGDFRPQAESLYTFDLIARGNVSAPVRLAATIEGQLAPTTRVVLVGPGGNPVFDLRETSEIVLPNSLSETGVRYKLLVGDEGNPAIPAPTSTLPRSFALAQNYPNPFNSSTTIGFDVSSSSVVKITIFDVLGRTVRALTHQPYSPGRYALAWDGHDENGQTVASGMYMYQLVADDVKITKKMVVLK